MRERSVNEIINWLVVLLAFSLPLYRAWVSLAAFLILTLWFFQGGLRDRVGKLRRHRLTLAVLFFVALNLISLLWSENPANGFVYWRKYLYLLLVPAVASSLKPVFAGRALLAFLGGTALSVLMMPVVILADIHIRHIHPGNPSATMSHLDYSMVLAVAALFVLVYLASTKRTPRVQRAGLVLLFGLLLGGLLLNIGRSGQLAFFGALAFVIPFLLRRRQVWFRAAVLAGVAGALIVTYLVVPSFNKRVDAAFVELHDVVVEQRVDTNQGKRVAGMMVAMEIVRSHPLLGTGIGGNMPEFRRLLETDFPQYRQAVGWFPHLHNQYLQVATELGVLGIVALLAIFVALFTGRYRHPQMRAAAIAVGCAYLIGFMGDPFLHKQLPLVLFALSAGVISSDDEVFTDTSQQSTADS
jgi:O-antigen ligase